VIIGGTYDDVLDASLLGDDESALSDLKSQRPRHLAILHLIDEHLVGSRETIVDLGPGNGALLRLAAQLGFTRLLAVDQEAWEHSFLSELKGVEHVRANFNEPRFLDSIPDGGADVVVSTEVLEHVFNHPWGYLQEAWRPVRPGGLLVLTTPNPCTLVNAIRLLAGRSVQWGDDWFARTPKVEDGALAAYPFVHYREYAPETFRALVADLRGARVVAHGYVANAGAPGQRRLKALALNTIHRVGLGGRRLFAHTQYAVVQNDGR
jgi:SAM-dependent methyltransferase